MIKSRLPTMLLAGLAAIVLHAAPAAAQQAQACPEGRTATGACVNARLAEDMRLGVLSATQPKLSVASPSLLPSQDGEFAQPRDRNEMQRLHRVDLPPSFTPR